MKILPMLFALVLGIASIPSNASAAWTLTNDERKAFLEYYAPIILKRGNGNKGDHARDWITNFDFDRDFVFNDNKREWRNIGRYVDAAARGPNAFYQRWQIRPTIYTSLMEYMDGGRKNLVLIYHVYHAMDEDASNRDQLHDWERIEIHVKNVSTARRPGRGELPAFAVITQHKRSVIRHFGSRDFNLVNTATGRHLLIWQAEWSGKLTGPHGQELRFIEDSAATILNDIRYNKKAEAEIIANGNDKNVHYAFVPGGSAGAVVAFGAKTLTYETAPQLASRFDNGDTKRWSQVPRVRYELQDLADIIPTHWAGGPFHPHWKTSKLERINVVTPFRNRDNQTISGLQTFYTDTLDIENTDRRDGYLSKAWFWGVYEIRDACDVNGRTIVPSLFGGGCRSGASQFKDNSFAGTARDSRGRTRIQANGGLGRSNFSWYHADNNDVVPTVPFGARVQVPSNSCNFEAPVTATATGGKQPYTFTWKLGSSVQYNQSGVTRSTQLVVTQTQYTVEVRDSAGAVRNLPVFVNRNCRGPGGGVINFQ